MKLIQWVKGWPIWAFLVTLFSLLAIAYLGSSAAGHRKRERKFRDEALAATADNSRTAYDRARTSNAMADAHMLEAERIKQELERELDRIGTNNETLRDIVSDWNADRLRR